VFEVKLEIYQQTMKVDIKGGLVLIFFNTWFYINKHNFHFDCLIELIFLQKVLKALFYIELKFHND
jgi:hypothetical protein